MTRALILLFAVFASSRAWANNIQPGQMLPEVQLNERGLLTLDQGEFSYHPWSTQSLMGKVFVIHAIAGRSSAKALNAPLMDAIAAAHYPAQQYQTVSIINLDDAIWGTSGFVVGKVENSMEQHPNAAFVIDNEGKVAQAWGLPSKSSTIIVIDQQGKVLFSQDGALSEQAIAEVQDQIQDRLTEPAN